MLLTETPLRFIYGLHNNLSRRRMVKTKLFCVWLISRRQRMLINCISVFIIGYYLTSWLLDSRMRSYPVKVIHSSKKEIEDIRNDSYALFYTSPGYPDLKGRTFSTTKQTLRELMVLASDYVTMSDQVAQEFVFATGASVAFFDMVKEAIASKQKHRPHDLMYVYDLGLSSSQVHEIKSMCNIKYRKFGYDLYPPHVKKKINYAWKPLIIADVLTRHPGVFWMDSSVRLTSGNFTVLLRQVQELGALALTSTGHSTYAATHPTMFKFLPPGDMEALKREQQWEATILIYKTQDVMTQVVKWMVMCALEKDCIAPWSARRGCTWHTPDHYGEYGKCHRYDQSAFNILMMNYIGAGSSWRYYAHSRVCKVERYLTGGVVPSYCGWEEVKKSGIVGGVGGGGNAQEEGEEIKSVENTDAGAAVPSVENKGEDKGLGELSLT